MVFDGPCINIGLGQGIVDFPDPCIAGVKAEVFSQGADADRGNATGHGIRYRDRLKRDIAGVDGCDRVGQHIASQRTIKQRRFINGFRHAQRRGARYVSGKGADHAIACIGGVGCGRCNTFGRRINRQRRPARRGARHRSMVFNLPCINICLKQRIADRPGPHIACIERVIFVVGTAADQCQVVLAVAGQAICCTYAGQGDVAGVLGRDGIGEDIASRSAIGQGTFIDRFGDRHGRFDRIQRDVVVDNAVRSLAGIARRERERKRGVIGCRLQARRCRDLTLDRLGTATKSGQVWPCRGGQVGRRPDIGRMRDDQIIKTGRCRIFEQEAVYAICARGDAVCIAQRCIQFGGAYKAAGAAGGGDIKLDRGTFDRQTGGRGIDHAGRVNDKAIDIRQWRCLDEHNLRHLGLTVLADGAFAFDAQTGKFVAKLDLVGRSRQPGKGVDTTCIRGGRADNLVACIVQGDGQAHLRASICLCDVAADAALGNIRLGQGDGRIDRVAAVRGTDCQHMRICSGLEIVGEGGHTCGCQLDLAGGAVDGEQRLRCAVQHVGDDGIGQGRAVAVQRFHGFQNRRGGRAFGIAFTVGYDCRIGRVDKARQAINDKFCRR